MYGEVRESDALRDSEKVHWEQKEQCKQGGSRFRPRLLGRLHSLKYSHLGVGCKNTGYIRTSKGGGNREGQE
jgi:hypothetical protein